MRKSSNHYYKIKPWVGLCLVPGKVYSNFYQIFTQQFLECRQGILKNKCQNETTDGRQSDFNSINYNRINCK